jgi:hypothetical protein
MTWEFVVALMVAVPLITFPAVFVWYVNAGGLYRSIKDRMGARGVNQHASPQAEHREIGDRSSGRPTGAT